MQGRFRELPPGWLDCPNFGRPVKLAPDRFLNIIPSKVPLSREYDDLIPHGKRYNLRSALSDLDRAGIHVGLVLDLTNSNRYYDFAQEIPDHDARGILYEKVRCRGRGHSPAPEDVNHACYEIWRYLSYFEDKFVFVHCTHGFNRSGYIIVCVLMRLMSNMGMSVERAVRRFSESRPPGIYKDGYITDLFKYHHERRSMSRSPCPRPPPWKQGDVLEDEAAEMNQDDADQGGGQNTTGEVGHDKIRDIGEPIPDQETTYILGMIQSVLLPGRDGHGPPFPGSQPVSLARANLELIRHRRYWVTWKADGTRYMMFIDTRGCYLVDRSANVVRLQMRFPTKKDLTKQQPHYDYPVGKPHFGTLLDGEMVVDVDKETNKRTRRYLIYDIMLINGMSLVEKPWKDRYAAIDSDIIKPRAIERNFIAGEKLPGSAGRVTYTAPPYAYDYGLEPFSVRRKEFWPLFKARKLVDNFIPSLCHEADGLILQGYNDQYKPLTCEELLKWKFSHLNSVDFLLRVVKRHGKPFNPDTDCNLLLMNSRRGRGGPDLVTLENTAVGFPEGIDPLSLDGRIIECALDQVNNKWTYMRVREDKDRPNASHVYEKVVKSIKDDIKDEELIGYLEGIFFSEEIYENDRRGVEVPQEVAQRLEEERERHAKFQEEQQHQYEEWQAAVEARGGEPYVAQSPPYIPADDPDLDGPYPVPEHLLILAANRAYPPPPAWDKEQMGRGDAGGEAGYGEPYGRGDDVDAAPRQPTYGLGEEPFYSDD